MPRHALGLLQEGPRRGGVRLSFLATGPNVAGSVTHIIQLLTAAGLAVTTVDCKLSKDRKAYGCGVLVGFRRRATPLPLPLLPPAAPGKDFNPTSTQRRSLGITPHRQRNGRSAHTHGLCW